MWLGQAVQLTPVAVSAESTSVASLAWSSFNDLHLAPTSGFEFCTRPVDHFGDGPVNSWTKLAWVSSDFLFLPYA